MKQLPHSKKSGLIIMVLNFFLLTRAYYYYVLIFSQQINPQSFKYASTALIVVILWILLTLKDSWRKGILATTGPYRFFAHPAYATYFLLDVILWSISEKTVPFVISSIGLHITLISAMRTEEKLLLKVFKKAGEIHLRRTLSIYFFTSKLS